MSDEPDWADFLVDLASLERVYSDVFDGPGEEQTPLLSADQLHAIPPESWGELRLQTAASLRLVEFRFPVQEYAAAVRKEKRRRSPARSRHGWRSTDGTTSSVAACWSRSPSICCRDFNRESPLGEAIAQAVETCGPPPDDLPSLLQQWFQTWTAAGYFVDVTVR